MQAPELHKRDALGRVEKFDVDGESRARRVASGGSVPGSAWIARRLLARERRALRALHGLAGVPVEIEAGEHETGVHETGAHGAADAAVLVRTWIDGVPLSRATCLPSDFFDRLDDLVLAMHRRRVCHNDLHKESNILVGVDGRPWLIDFQLASVHADAGRAFDTRCREDLRHVEKHRRRYTRHGRGPEGRESRGVGHGIPRSRLARAWRRFGKPMYVAVTRGLFDTRDGGDAQRASSGPWPTWTAPLGASLRSASDESSTADQSTSPR